MYLLILLLFKESKYINPISGNRRELEDFVERNHKIPKPRISIDENDLAFFPTEKLIAAEKTKMVDVIAIDSLPRFESHSRITELTAKLK
jgi:hypothetical protein